MSARTSAWRWRSGTVVTRSSRSGCSASPAPRATTARTSRSTGGSSTPCRATRGCTGATTIRSPSSRMPPWWVRTPGATSRNRSSSSWTPGSSTRTATGWSTSSTPRRTRTTCSWRSASPTQAPTRPRCTCCHSCGSATRGRGTSTQSGLRCARRHPVAWVPSTHGSAIWTGSSLQARAALRPSCSSATTTPTPVGSTAPPTHRHTPRTASTTMSWAGRRRSTVSAWGRRLQRGTG